MFEKYLFFRNKYFFPIAVLFFGLLLLIKGVTGDAETGIKQTSGFTQGGIVILVMGIISLLYSLDLITRKIHLGLVMVLAVVAAFLAVASWTSIETTISEIEKKKETDAAVKQGLMDIRDLQVEYMKKYDRYADSFSKLTTFVLTDKLIDRKPWGVVPDRKLNPEEAIQLGYDPMTAEGERQMESFSDEEAIKLKLFGYDTTFLDVMDVMFTGADAINKDRAYPFDATKLGNIPMNEEKEFIMMTRMLEDSSWALMVKDPFPYDPFGTEDTLTIGSLTESKTNGNWGEK